MHSILERFGFADFWRHIWRFASCHLLEERGQYQREGKGNTENTLPSPNMLHSNVWFWCLFFQSECGFLESFEACFTLFWWWWLWSLMCERCRVVLYKVGMGFWEIWILILKNCGFFIVAYCYWFWVCLKMLLWGGFRLLSLAFLSRFKPVCHPRWGGLLHAQMVKRGRHNGV